MKYSNEKSKTYKFSYGIDVHNSSDDEIDLPRVNDYVDAHSSIGGRPIFYFLITLIFVLIMNAHGSSDEEESYSYDETYLLRLVACLVSPSRS